MPLSPLDKEIRAAVLARISELSFSFFASWPALSPWYWNRLLAEGPDADPQSAPDHNYFRVAGKAVLDYAIFKISVGGILGKGPGYFTAVEACLHSNDVLIALFMQLDPKVVGTSLTKVDDAFCAFLGAQWEQCGQATERIVELLHPVFLHLAEAAEAAFTMCRVAMKSSPTKKQAGKRPPADADLLFLWNIKAVQPDYESSIESEFGESLSFGAGFSPIFSPAQSPIFAPAASPSSSPLYAGFNRYADVGANWATGTQEMSSGIVGLGALSSTPAAPNGPTALESPFPLDDWLEFTGQLDEIGRSPLAPTNHLTGRGARPALAGKVLVFQDSPP